MLVGETQKDHFFFNKSGLRRFEVSILHTLL